MALVCTLFITDFFTRSESQRRAATSVDDALINGTLALHLLEAAIREAGAGITHQDLLGCSLALGNGVTLSDLAPVVINHPDVPAGDASTDTVLMVSGNDFGSPDGYLIGAAIGSSYPVTPASFFTPGDRVIAAPRIPCSTVLLLDQVASVMPPTVEVENGASNVSGGKLYALGRSPSVVGYAVRDGQLTRCDLLARSDCLSDASVWEPVAGGIVSLKAQYGIDTGASVDGTVETYASTPPGGYSIQCNWAHVLTVRIALAARGVQEERSTIPLWTTPVEWADFDLSQTDANWQNFHYRFFQVLAPIRGLLSGGVQGC